MLSLGSLISYLIEVVVDKGNDLIIALISFGVIILASGSLVS